MNDNLNDNNQVSALLKAYSIQEITSIFGEIDEKILSLHACSSEDFLTLNTYFKKYYSDSKTISSNATNLFNSFTNEESRKDFFKLLKEFQETLNDLLTSYENSVDQIIDSVSKMIQEMDQMFVTANNLKQDLMTLKLLVANLQLDVTVSAAPSVKIARKTNDFNELIIQTKSFFIEFYKHSNLYKESMKLLKEQIVQQRNHNIQHISEILNEVNYSSNLLDRGYNEAVQLVPKLSEATQNTSNSIAKIITNLQYQDIIRQKIDHIQQTHKDILSELTKIKEVENEETNLHNQVKCFIQIRDVAGLQAAQLIHANKEYQKAIEIISGRFLEVGNDMTNISNLCQQLIGNPNNTSGSHYDEIREKLEKTGYFTELFQKSLFFLTDKTEIHQKLLQELIENYDELSDFIYTIDKSIIKSLNNQSPLEVDQFEKTTKQIREVLTELKAINDQYHSQFERIKDFGLLATKASQNINPTDTVETKLTHFTSLCVKLIDILYENNEDVYKIIADNQLLSKSISADIKTSLEQIKYYDYFDKVIEEIIAKLNEINVKLTYFDGSSNDSNRQQQLEYLKSRYTMESEHIIHDHLIKKDVDLEQLNSTGMDEDDDNLELF
jgi:hypothetical protein